MGVLASSRSGVSICPDGHGRFDHDSHAPKLKGRLYEGRMTELFEGYESRVASGPRPQTVGRRFCLAIGVSILLLVPCVWHRQIEAGDLGSHLYNAWLAQLIGRGQAPGLYIVSQWTNILADKALAWLGSALGFVVAERIVVGLSVLIFFWGAFAFITVMTQRAPWFLASGIAMVAYGYTFQMGLLNYYLSVGLAFWAIAFFFRGRTLDWIVGLALTSLVVSAHLLGFTWLAGTVAYIKLAERMSRGRWALAVATLLAILGIHFYVAHFYRTYDPVLGHVYLFLGLDQLVLYSHRYRVLAMVVLLSIILIVLPEAIRKRRSSEFWGSVRTPLELWVIAVFATAMLWSGLTIPRYGASFGYLAPRFSSITAVLGLCILGCIEPRRWHAIALAICAAIFFVWMYQDTSRVARMEEQAERLINGLPQGTRVIQTIFMPPGSRIGAAHILDRACIGRCFAYANYEPASRQFRIRAQPGNPIVTVSSAGSAAMQAGDYLVRPEDLPLTEVYQCDERDLSRLCVRNLVAGETNGRAGYIAPY